MSDENEINRLKQIIEYYPGCLCSMRESCSVCERGNAQREAEDFAREKAIDELEHKHNIILIKVQRYCGSPLGCTVIGGTEYHYVNKNDSEQVNALLAYKVHNQNLIDEYWAKERAKEEQENKKYVDIRETLLAALVCYEGEYNCDSCSWDRVEEAREWVKEKLGNLK